ncbi:MAG: translocation/assembly module TamB domain-containing protein [Treponema sp.]|nr:translocation/assembly module TamB domain-containing protein [Treponema sp.]
MKVKPLPFRIYAQILIFSALVVLGAFILWHLQRVMQEGIVGVRDNLIIGLEQQIDRKIRYSSISPSIFGSFDVRNVRIMGRDDQPVLTMSRFRVAYSLLDLLRGRHQAIHSIRIDSPHIDFNTARDNDLLELFETFRAGGNNSPHNLAAQFPEKLIVRIRNGRFQIFNGGDTFEIDALNFNAEIIGGQIQFDGRWNIGVVVDRLIGTPVTLWLAMRTNGSLYTNMEEGEAQLELVAVTGDAYSVVPVSLGLVLQENIISLKKMPNQLSFDFSLDYGLGTEHIDVQFACNDFKLRDFLFFSGGLVGASPLLDIVSSGAASFEQRPNGVLGYSANLAGTALAPAGNPALNVASMPVHAAEAAFEIYIKGDENRAQVDQFRFSIPVLAGMHAFFFGDINFSGSIGLHPFAPEGILSLSHFSLSGTESMNADVDIYTHNNTINVSCETLNLGQFELNALSAMVKPLGDNLHFTVSVLDNARKGSISLEGAMNSETRYMDASLRLTSFSAGDLNDMAAPFVKNIPLPSPSKGLISNTLITTEIFITTDFVRFSYNAPRFHFVSGVGHHFEGFAVLSGTDRRFELSEARIRRGEEQLLLSGLAEFTDAKNGGFSINAHYKGLEYLVEGTVQDGKSVNILGSYGFAVHFAVSNDGHYSGSMQANGFPVPFLGQPALLSFALQLRYDNMESWFMALERFELADITSPAGPAQVRISGRADQYGAVVPLLYYSDGIGPLSGRANITWTADYSELRGSVDMREGREQYQLEGSIIDRRAAVALSGSSMRLDRIFGRAVELLADGRIRLILDPDNSFNAVFNVSSAKGKVFGKNFSANAFAALNAGEFIVNTLNVSYDNLEGSVSNFSLNGAQGTAGTSIKVNGFTGGRSVEGNVSLAANFSPIRSWFELGTIVDAVNGTIRVEEFSYGSEGQPQTFDIRFSRADGAFAVSGGPRNMLRFRMDHDGNFYAGLSSPFPVRGTVVGSIQNRSINARCGDLYVDLADLFELLPENPNFFMTGGYVNGAVDIRGPLNDPDFFGTVRATSLRIRLPNFIPQELRPIPFTVAIEGNEMRFGSVATVVGSGAGAVNGWFQFDRWIPNIFNLDITIPRETPIPYGFDLSGFLANGDAWGKLNVSMENQAFDISGNLYANNTELGLNSDEIGRSQRAGAFSKVRVPFVADLTVITGPVVEFFYPSSRFPILRVNPDMGTRLHLTADSLARQYTLTSDVRIRGGEIYYFERSFYIRSGQLTFRENEIRFSPRLTARAEVRDRTEDGPVTISMIIDNAPLLSFNARFESSPSLSQVEIFSLLGQNITGTLPEESASSIQRAFLYSGSELLANFLVGRQLEQQIRNFMRLDMFNVRTHVLQNYVYQAMTQPPVDRTGRVGNYFDNTTVFGGKYIGQDMFIQGMLSMRYDENRIALGGLTFMPEFGLEWQSPLFSIPWDLMFSIRWDFVPMHPENWFVNDNSITLTWSRSF